MANLLKILAYLPDLPSLFGLINDISQAVKAKTEANIDIVINDLKPFVEHWCSGIPTAEVDAVALDLIALVTIGANHSVHNCEAVALTIVESLPKFGLPITQQHADALVQPLSDALGDFGVK